MQKMSMLAHFGARFVERETISGTALVELLIADTTLFLGEDARFLGEKIALRHRKGEPNWDANCGIVTTSVLMAFARAFARAQERYNLEGGVVGQGTPTRA
jgi:hypothetical protein